MLDRRVKSGLKRGRRFEIEVDGEKIIAYEGETIASAILASGRRTLRYTPQKGHPRGIYCGIGLCHDCIMTVDGIPNTRTCQTLATPGCRVETQKGSGHVEQPV
ncbi:MAG: (2Fe-2S)-binding protein [Deltaproteobacteria bacterium]|nr:(2Fe-2S)-binding protein [Deltaproteobacteria bacterium]